MIYFDITGRPYMKFVQNESTEKLLNKSQNIETLDTFLIN